MTVTCTTPEKVRPRASVATAESAYVPAAGAGAEAVNGPLALLVPTTTPLTRNCTVTIVLSASVMLAASGTLSPTTTVIPSGGLVMASVGWVALVVMANWSVAVLVPPAFAAKRRIV